MNDLVLSASAADADAVEAIRTHHAQLAGGLDTKVSALVEAFRAGRGAVEAQRELVEWCSVELLPHALAEEAALYPAGLALPGARMLVEAMTNEHQTFKDLIEELRQTTDALQAVRAAAALRVVFDSHLVKENDQLLPALAQASGVSLRALLEKMHALLTDHAAGELSSSAGSAHGAESCSCGEHNPAGDPELDATLVPHAIRHATVFGALDAVKPGAALVLVAPHDPLPLLAQLERRNPATFSVSYLQRGPEAWRLRISRNAPH